MAGAFSDYLENRTLDHFFGGTASTPAATLYVAFSTTAPTDAGGNVTEPVGNNYARVAVTNNATNFPAASGGVKTNGVAILSGVASGSWGTITHAAIYDAPSGGNFYGSSDLPASKTVGNLDTLNLAVGALSITLT